jgi:two-component system chemotaxis response regulator CheB
MKKIRVLVVDDSATMRRLLTDILSNDAEIEVVGGAPEPAIARTMIKELNPDVITLDVEMPHMNGLEFLDKIMRLRPMPVVMVSSLTQRGAEVTLEALELGAVDYFAKPKENAFGLLASSSTELAEKVKTAARANVRARTAVRNFAHRQNLHADFKPSSRIVAIGSSTGGVEALIEVLSNFPENCPPTLITQHMPPGFTKSFADRLNRLCRAIVAEATEGAVLEKGHVYLAPGGDAHLKLQGSGRMRCHLSPGAPVSGHRPSVDVLFNSIVTSGVRDAVGVILTGMGRDGAAGLKAMRDAGSPTIGQDEGSCVVYGMPRAAFDAGAVAEQLPLEKIGPEILRLCHAHPVELKDACRV